MAVAALAMVAVPLATPASAAQSVACAKESSAIKSGKATSTFALCTPAALSAGGTGVTPKTPPPGTKAGQLALVITWKNGKGKTNLSLKYTTQSSLGKCKAPTKRIKATGSVTGGSGAALKIAKKGEPVSASVCVYTTGPKLGQSSLEPGTKFKF